jgi:hypothetical protein
VPWTRNWTSPKYGRKGWLCPGCYRRMSTAGKFAEISDQRGLWQPAGADSQLANHRLEAFPAISVRDSMDARLVSPHLMGLYTARAFQPRPMRFF